jgi:hypothetical protein
MRLTRVVGALGKYGPFVAAATPFSDFVASTDAKPSRGVVPGGPASLVGLLLGPSPTPRFRPEKMEDSQPGWSASSPSAAEPSSFSTELWLPLRG